MLAVLFVVLAVAIRFLPFLLGYTPVWNFTPVGAALLFFGAKQSRKHMWFPVLLLAASDIILNRFVYNFPITWETFVSTGWYAIALALGYLLKDKVSPMRVVGASLASSVSFFLVSNFAVWAAYNMYPHTIAGLGACYVAAIPFFRGTIAADMIYAVAIFGAPVVFEAMQRQFSRSQVAA
ncbi:MAG TPA: DUF6580 family putative transport protein [Terriglobales bacterium]|nr:DUF6580 family putative transport protein [Terriglobales bacterium]